MIKVDVKITGRNKTFSKKLVLFHYSWGFESFHLQTGHCCTLCQVTTQDQDQDQGRGGPALLEATQHITGLLF